VRSTTSTLATSACNYLLAAVDLTRASCASHNYLSWLALHEAPLGGSAGITQYITRAAIAYEEQARQYQRKPFSVAAFDARDNLADILMASAPLTEDELQAAVTMAIHEARFIPRTAMSRFMRKQAMQ
jgi:hypothetical protein